MAISKWAGGIVILIAFVVAGKTQAANETKSMELQQTNKIVTEQQLIRK